MSVADDAGVGMLHLTTDPKVSFRWGRPYYKRPQ